MAVWLTAVRVPPRDLLQASCMVGALCDMVEPAGEGAENAGRHFPGGHQPFRDIPG